MHDQAKWRVHWRVEKYDGDITPESEPYEVIEREGNLLLNGGITELWNLIAGTGTPTAFDATNARIGVGDSTTAAAAGQTGLQAGTNKAYKPMNASYPSVSGQTVSFQADFGTADANFAWQEWVIDNQAASGTATLNRKVSSLGTKTSSNTWRFGVSITLA